MRSKKMITSAALSALLLGGVVGAVNANESNVQVIPFHDNKGTEVDLNKYEMITVDEKTGKAYDKDGNVVQIPKSNGDETWVEITFDQETDKYYDQDGNEVNINDYNDKNVKFERGGFTNTEALEDYEYTIHTVDEETGKVYDQDGNEIEFIESNFSEVGEIVEFTIDEETGKVYDQDGNEIERGGFTNTGTLEDYEYTMHTVDEETGKVYDQDGNEIDIEDIEWVTITFDRKTGKYYDQEGNEIDINDYNDKNVQIEFGT
ncbi:hypothetical protein [Chengkuizengella sediminis]|uniref:hypothetical protein n=1 Tax=Chengkuizengella sediminis TaxID=1885917 RepID=UPI001389793D|nr:hypothetical protein [Chengkuizengella sediminis]NDI36156.1 hypothetical protein [Chengkuizengella sediminis]